MKSLYLETSTEACSAALYLDGEVTERYQLAPQQHNKFILPMIESSALLRSCRTLAQSCLKACMFWILCCI
jgi:tRNA A37 threonylcarbamoyladenosine modification protein TsaB